MELLVISSPSCFKGEPELINALFDEGLKVFHWRKPGLNKRDYGHSLEGIADRYRNRVALHQHHDISEDFGTKRLHFPESLRRVQDRAVLAGLCCSYVLSTSVHDTEELAHLQDFNYAFAGPVFDSYSKLGYRGIADKHFVLQPNPPESARHRSNMKVIALGGIGLKTIGKIKRMGFDGAAMLGWIWNDPSKAIEHFKQVKCQISAHT